MITQMFICRFYSVPKGNKLKYRIEKVGKNGLKLYWAYFEDQKEPSADTPVLLFYPGMTGYITDKYVQAMLVEALLNGYHVCFYQMRILSDDMYVDEKKIYKLHEDLDETFDYIRENYKSKIYCVGGSYGANNLLFYLGELGCLKKKVEALVCVSNPYDMYLCQRLCQGTIYSNMVVYLERKHFNRILPAIKRCKNLDYLDINYLKTCNNFIGYDEECSKKIYGFRNSDDYYMNISPIKNMHKVNVPVLCINSLDDQICPGNAIPYPDIRDNDNIMLLTTDRGAHMCFFGNENFFKFKQWHLKYVFEFLNSIRDQKIQ